jgi:Cd2+/Zn2+-exporting ATPase
MSVLTRKIDVPFESSDDPTCCPQILLETLVHHKGVVGAQLDTNTHTLTMDYNPDLIKMRQVNRIANEAGIKLRNHYEDCLVHIEQGISTRCGTCEQLERQLHAMPGIASARVNASAGVLSVEYISAATSRPQIEQAVVQLGYNVKEAAEDIEQRFLQRERLEPAFVVITLLALLGGVLADKLGAPGWAVAALAVVAYFTGGIYGLRDGIEALIQRTINVDLLMIIAALGAATIGSWPEGATLLFLFSLSNVLQNFAMDRSRKAIHKLLDLRPDTALVRRGDQEIEVPVDDLRPGEIVIVKPGDRIAIDGEVTSGQSAVNQASITGESEPVFKQPGDTVFAGTINENGSLEVRVTKLASETVLSKIIKMVEEAQAHRAPTQRFIDTFEQYYAIVVIAATVLFITIPTLVFKQPFETVFYRGMVLLVVASPCALVISTPASILSAIANAARNGVLFKGGAHLENAATIKVVALDKTGTLTAGRPGVTDILTFNGYSEDQLLALTAAVEARSEHPLAQSVVRAAKERELDILPAGNFQAVPGMGVRAAVDGLDLLVGSRRFIESEGYSLSDGLNAEVERLESDGKTVLLVYGNKLLGAVGVADEPREAAKETIKSLKRLGVDRVVMLTGDNPRVAEAVAQQVGVDEFHAGLLPEDKVTLMKQLEEKYGPVAMIGDGVNDAPALAAATLGVAMGGAGTDVALETADVVLMADDLSRLPYVIKLSKRARRIVWQNIAFSLGVIVMLILGTFIVSLPLPLGVVGHEGSTVIVVFNGLRLLAFGAGRVA